MIESGAEPLADLRAPLPWRAAAWLATLLALAALGLVVVHWGWRWFGPAPAPMPIPPAPERYAPAIIAAAPFGGAGPEAAPPRPAASTLQGETRLLGVFAQGDGRGQALFRLADRGPVLVDVGQAVAEDVTLVAVRPDGVRIRDHGAERELVLRPGAPATLAASARVSSTGSANRTACLAPPGFKGAVYRLNAELLGGAASQPESWSAFLAPVPGGLAIRGETGLAPLLGMKAGDRMAQANGIALAGVEDVLVAFVKPLLASQSVHVLGLRDGKPAEWLFVNATTCP